jgi:hypothetical protein
MPDVHLVPAALMASLAAYESGGSLWLKVHSLTELNVFRQELSSAIVQILVGPALALVIVTIALLEDLCSRSKTEKEPELEPLIQVSARRTSKRRFRDSKKYIDKSAANVEAVRDRGDENTKQLRLIISDSVCRVPSLFCFLSDY